MDELTTYIERTETYLRLSGERRTAEAAAFLASDAELIFPGGVTYSRLEDVFASAGRMYRSIAKRHGTWDAVSKADGTVVVVSAGTLEGENLHGARFEGVRYLDRITWRDGQIVRQEVWNDLAVSGVLDVHPARD